MMLDGKGLRSCKKVFFREPGCSFSFGLRKGSRRSDLGARISPLRLMPGAQGRVWHLKKEDQEKWANY